MPVKKKATPANGAKSVKIASPSMAQNDAPNESSKQLQLFEQGARQFRAQLYREARETFVKAAEGPQKEVSHNARLHMIMCDRRLNVPVLNLNTLDDHYNYAIERINARDLECARQHLDTAMNLSTRDGVAPDHLLYALAICASLAGDLRGAYENLKRAIDLDPKNRLAARNDSDFSSVAQQPLVQQLLYPEKFNS
jgi:tetratricopeptide (TPR) repeat protein